MFLKEFKVLILKWYLSKDKILSNVCKSDIQEKVNFEENWWFMPVWEAILGKDLRNDFK